MVGTPLSIESTTGKAVYIVVEKDKPTNRMSEAEKKNELEVEGIVNLPNGFGWTDVPPLPKGHMNTKKSNTGA